MTYSLELTHEAKLDIHESWYWYEFLISLEASINQIQRNPLLFEVKMGNVRVAPLRRFPFKVAYIIQENTVGVIAVIHHKGIQVYG